MKECRSWLEKILAGEDSQEIRNHLKECPDCAAAKSAWEIMKNASAPSEVPEFLSANIRNYAVSAVRRKQHHFRLKYIWMPAAAALFICFGLTYSIGLGTHPAPGTAVKPNLLQSEIYGEMDSLDSDLFALTAQLEHTSDSLLGEALLSSIMTPPKQESNI